MSVSINHEIQMLYANAFTKLLANLTSYASGDLGKAEDALQDAFIKALTKWPKDGLPPNPAGWIFTTAKRKLIDGARHKQVENRKQSELKVLAKDRQRLYEETTTFEADNLPDQRLELLFTCCHPLLSAEGQVAITLQVFSGMNIETIARALMVTNSTMAKRLTRAKTKIRNAKIAFELPAKPDYENRLEVILQVIYLIFNEGYLPKEGASLLKQSLCDEAIELGSLLNQLYSKRADVMALLALMLFSHSRRKARLDADGQLVTLEGQDRQLWDTQMIEKASQLLDAALTLNALGEYQIQAAIAALHAKAPRYEKTDWRQIALLYERLLRLNDRPVVRLSHAVAIAMALGPEPALALLDKLEQDNSLKTYHLFYSAKAEILAMSAKISEATANFEHAISICENKIEKSHMQRRLTALK